MSTPMHDLPDHWLLPVDAAGKGPVGYDDAVRWACACGGRDDCPYDDPLPCVDCEYCASPNDPLLVWCAACATMLPRPPMTLPGKEHTVYGIPITKGSGTRHPVEDEQ